ncbi:LysR family transcriptional regulator [Rhodobacteraceae bacterium DSL-40]|uniref:LysR family transcriptional regulator n=1 Tax=Amaricoccus sp. B4 TaxID=3368557 RepID=UPI000DAEB53F
MSEIDLSRLDLNLLVVFTVLMRERNVTRAAEDLGRTQSAVSHSLARLRAQLGDPLLIKAGGRMTPTPYALRLHEDIVPILRSIQHVVSPPEPFDPATSRRQFRIAFPDNSRAFLTNIYARVQREAPGVAVEWLTPSADMLPMVAGGQIDICELAGSAPLPEGVEAHQGQPYTWMTYMRRDHPAAQDWGPAAWKTWPHVKVSVDTRSPSPVDEVTRGSGLTRRIGARIPNFASLGPLLARTDFIATLPPITMVDVLEEYDILALQPPVEIAPMPLRFLWSFRLSNDPGSRWFRNLVIETFSELHRKAEVTLATRWIDRAMGKGAPRA